MGTRKSVDQILDKAAAILEKRGFTTSLCYDPETGGFCALGAIARATYPKMKNEDIGDVAYRDGFDGDIEDGDDPRYLEAIRAAASTIARRKVICGPAHEVYIYNDRAKSPKTVVKMLRRAAENARKATV